VKHKPAKEPITPKKQFEDGAAAIEGLRSKKTAAVTLGVQLSGGDAGFGGGEVDPASTAASAIETPPVAKDDVLRTEVDVVRIIKQQLAEERHVMILWAVGLLVTVLLAVWGMVFATASDLRTDIRDARSETSTRIERLEARLQSIDDRLRAIEQARALTK